MTFKWENNRVYCCRCHAGVLFKTDDYGPPRIIEIPSLHCGKHTIEVQHFRILFDGQVLSDCQNEEQLAETIRRPGQLGH